MLERFHRWVAIALAIPLLVWSITGLMFHLKPGWARAYDQLSIERATALDPTTLAPLATLPTEGKISAIEVFDSALGPMYRVHLADHAALFDARTGRARSPLSVDDARALALDAVTRSSHRADYGDASDAIADAGVVRVRFHDGIDVSVSRDDGAITQHGADTARIDWLYRIHYLQWTGNRTVDRALAVFGLALIWAALIPGLVLFVRRVRRRR